VRPDTADAYARRCVVNAATDHRRSLFRRHEQVRAQLPDIVSADVEPGDAATILALLAALPPGMRVTVVLRYVEGLSVGQPGLLGRSAPQAAPGAHASRVRLVAYTGAQPIGFIVSTVPAGWQVASSDRAAFVLQAGSRRPADSPVTKVTVNGRPGVLGFPYGGGLWLIFPDAKGHKILIQIPESLHLTTDQIVRFAQGRMRPAGPEIPHPPGSRRRRTTSMPQRRCPDHRSVTSRWLPAASAR
jgi:hypothetical protein